MPTPRSSSPSPTGSVPLSSTSRSKDVTAQGPGGQRVYTVPGGGSGVVIAPDGYILQQPRRPRREEPGSHPCRRRTLPARVIGDDPATDLAVIQTTAGGLPAARLGDSDSLSRDNSSSPSATHSGSRPR